MFGNLNSLGNLSSLGVQGNTKRLQLSELFSNNTEGIYLPSLRDAVMYQDSTGAVPVTGVEQPVGKIIEGSQNANSIIQPTDADRPILSARVNMLQETATLSTQSVTTSAGDYVVSFSGAGSITFSGTNTDIVTAGSTTITCSAGTLTATVTGNVTQADLRQADQATGLLPDYQRVGDVDTDPTDYDYEKFPWYLAFNGVNTWMYVPNMTPNSDEVFICAGVRKASDDVTGILLELTENSTVETQSFRMLAPSTSGANSFRFGSRGTSAPVDVGTGTFAPAPDTAAIRGVAKIGSDTCELYLNNSLIGSSPGDQSTGTYANETLYIGSREGSSLFFNGNIYSLILTFRIPSDRVISKVERLVNQNTRAY